MSNCRYHTHIVFRLRTESVVARQVAQEEEAITKVFANYHKGYETKEQNLFKNLISSTADFMFFGSDVAEVINSSAEMVKKKVVTSLFNQQRMNRQLLFHH